MRADRLDELRQTRLDYWRELVSRVGQSGSPITFGEPSPAHQLRASATTFGSGKFILVALANVRPELRIGAGVEVSGPKEYYSVLAEDASRIEREIGCERAAGEWFEWNPETKVRDVWLYRRADFFERREWLRQHEWLCEKLESFRRVLKPRVERLLRTGA